MEKDELKTPVTFTAFGDTFTISSYYHKNELLPPPNGDIVFGNSVKKTFKTPKKTFIEDICTYTTNSKKELKFLLKHIGCGVCFFRKRKRK